MSDEPRGIYPVIYYEARCNGCGDQWGDEVVAYQEPSQVAESLRESDWSSDEAGNVWHCPDCPNLCDHEWEPPEQKTTIGGLSYTTGWYCDLCGAERDEDPRVDQVSVLRAELEALPERIAQDIGSMRFVPTPAEAHRGYFGGVSDMRDLAVLRALSFTPSRPTPAPEAMR